MRFVVCMLRGRRSASSRTSPRSLPKSPSPISGPTAASVSSRRARGHGSAWSSDLVRELWSSGLGPSCSASASLDDADSRPAGLCPGGRLNQHPRYRVRRASSRVRPKMSVMDRKEVGDQQLDAVLERLDRLCEEMHALNRHLDTSEHLLRISRELSTLNESLQALAYAALGQQAPTVRRRRAG